jgi:hypothetical protein
VGGGSVAKAKQAKKTMAAAHADIRIQEGVQVEIISMDLIQLNPYNPKKPMSKDRKKGLNRSLTEFGFKGVVLVSAHPDDDGEYVVLDGNTRIEELRRRGIEKVPCLVYHDIAAWEDIKKFTITYDRNVKAYDEDKVLGQLRELAEAGEDIGQLSDLSNIPNLDDLLAPVTGIPSPVTDAGAPDEYDSILISGPKVVIDAIRDTAKLIKGKLPLQDKLLKILRDMENLEWEEDEDLIVFLLLAAAHKSGASNKLVIPCASGGQKRAIIEKALEFIGTEGIKGDFALSRAIEYMTADK